MEAAQFEQLLKDLEKARKDLDKARQKVDNLTKQRDEACPHTDLEKKSDYDSGSYYAKASTAIWMECKCCGARGPKTVKVHSWYG